MPPASAILTNTSTVTSEDRTMGRAFEYRRAAKEKRWAKMSSVFPKLAKAITIAARNGGPDITVNSSLRMAIQNAKRENMPKDNIEAAIKRATDKNEKGLEEVVYEGYGPNGIAVMVECATDNTTRSIANVRTIFSKAGGSVGKSGTVDYLFTRSAVFRIAAAGQSIDDLELELIDYGLEELFAEDDELVLLAPFESFGEMQKGLEAKGIPILKADVQRFPNSTTALTAEQFAALDTFLEKLDNDDDVQAVYHNAAEA